MKTIFKIWLFLVITIFIIYTPIHLFSNNAVDEVEDATLSELIYSIGPKGMDYEATLKRFSSNDIDISKKLVKAFDDNLLIEKYEIYYNDSEEARKIEASTGLKVITASLKTSNNSNIKLDFLVLDKAYYRSFAEVLAIYHITGEKDNFKYSLEDAQERFRLVTSLFAKDKNISRLFVESIEEKLIEMASK